MKRLSDQRGFTLPELVMVIVIVAILAVVVTPSAALFPGMKVNAAAERVASDLRYAQALAHREGGPVGLAFSSATRYAVVHTTAKIGVPDPLQPAQSLVFDTVADARFKGVTWTWTTPSLDNQLLFDTLGQLRDDVYEVATTPATIVLTLSSTTATISVEPVTGRISTMVTP